VRLFYPAGGKLEGWLVLQENPDEGDAQIVEKILGMRTVSRQVPKEVGLTVRENVAVSLCRRLPEVFCMIIHFLLRSSSVRTATPSTFTFAVISHQVSIFLISLTAYSLVYIFHWRNFSQIQDSSCM